MASSQGIQLLVVVIVVVVLSSSSSAVAAAPPTIVDWKKLGCTDSCGNVSIPYPFGLNEKCYLNQDFLITCNHSQGQPYLRHSTIPVTNISFETGELRVMQFISRDCYDGLGAPLENNIYALLTLAKFSISNTKNKFTAIGCDTNGYVHISENETSFAATGCQSQCSSIDYVSNGTCAGLGCCQTSIPKGVGKINISARSFHNHTNVSDFNPCSYAFVVEDGAFHFSTTYLQNFTEERMPMVLDWAIGFTTNTTCEEAKRNQTSYACGENADCYNAQNGPGYLCKCLEGYEGNPYFSDGCQDINECENPHQKVCVDGSECINTIGNYTCSCPKRYHGDGRPNGTRCIADQFLLIQIVAGVCVGSTGLLFLLIVAWWLYKVIKKRNDTKRKEEFFKRNGGFLLQQQLSSSDGSVEKTKLFNSNELKKATDNYNEDRILGQGGQGTVYKGMLSDGRIIAVKKSKVVDINQFINEVVILSQINHKNVLKLLGCCLEIDVPLLVYEFIPNGTLSQHIHDPNEEFPLSWEMRFRIATEVAGGLSYLHNATSVPIYHRDIKSANILLDDKYKVKVSDFGTSRSVAVDQTHLTTLVQGTFGYLDPEYFQSSRFTEKSDVYSFGVVIVELLTGLKPVFSQESRSLVTHFMQSMKENRLLEILDPRILKEDRREEMIVVAHLARRCLHLNGKKRPTMKEVEVELEGIRMSQGCSTTHQHYEEVEYDSTDRIETWNVASTSTEIFLDCGTDSFSI